MLQSAESSFEAAKSISIKTWEGGEEGPEVSLLRAPARRGSHWCAHPERTDSCLPAQDRGRVVGRFLPCLPLMWELSLAAILPWVLWARLFLSPGKNRAPTVCMAECPGLRGHVRGGRIGWFFLEEEPILVRAEVWQAGRTKAKSQVLSLHFLASASPSVRWG